MFRILSFFLGNMPPVYAALTVLWLVVGLLCLWAIVLPIRRLRLLSTRLRAAGAALLVIVGTPVLVWTGIELVSAAYAGKAEDGIAAKAPTARDGPRQLLFASVLAGNYISVVDLDGFKEIKRIPANGDGPGSLVLTPDGRKLYALNAGPRSNTMNVIDPATLRAGRQVAVAGKLGDRAAKIQADGRYIYTSSFPDFIISRVDTRTDKVVKVYREFTGGPDIAVSPDGGTLFGVERKEGGGGSSLVAFDAESGRRVGSLSWDEGEFDMGKRGFGYLILSADGTRAIVSGDPVRFIDVRDRTRPKLAATIATGSASLIPALTPDGRELWLPGSSNGRIVVIDTQAMKVARVIPTDRYMMHICFSADGRTAYVSQTRAEQGPPKPRWLMDIAVLQSTIGSLSGSKQGVYHSRPLIDTPSEIAAYDAASGKPLALKPVRTTSIAGPLACIATH